MTYTVELTTDPAAFLDVAGAWLAAEPVVGSVMATVTSRHVEKGADADTTDRPLWWAVVRGPDLAVAGLAMRTARTPPHPLFVLPMPDGAARALAHAVHARGEPVAGVNGSLPAARVCAAELAGLQGGGVGVIMHTRLFELGELAAPRGVPGRLRAATLSDLDLTVEWVSRFESAADEQAGRVPDRERHDHIEPADVRRRIERGTYWFWLDTAGERVHLTGAGPPAFGVDRIGPVYTPPEHRRHGYAGAAVSAVSQLLRDGGARVCLYTDQANPTSNRIYQAIGYRPVVDQMNLRIMLT